MGGTLSGSLDVNLAASSAALANPFTGTIAPPDSTGRFAGAFNGQVFEFSPFAVDYYIIDPSHGFFVETDLVNPNSSFRRSLFRILRGANAGLCNLLLARSRDT